MENNSTLSRFKEKLQSLEKVVELRSRLKGVIRLVFIAASAMHRYADGWPAVPSHEAGSESAYRSLPP